MGMTIGFRSLVSVQKFFVSLEVFFNEINVALYHALQEAVAL